MLFALKKFVSYFLMPLQFSLGLILVGALLAVLTRRVRLGRILVFVGVGLLLVLSHKQVGMALLQPLETRYAAIPDVAPGAPVPAALAACQAVVVLGGGHSDTPGLAASHRLSASALARVAEGARIARLLPKARVICSGPGETGQDSHAAVLARAATALGVDPGRIELIADARDTEEEAAALARRFGAEPIAVVTSAWHMPRTVALLRRHGLNVVPCPADFTARPNPDFRWNNWNCDLSGLERSTKAIYEYLGLTWAKLRGRA
ncbi:MAG: YdcF family protein [Opitutaceae bacterium]|nr:YdcF family protein [Opitutaceae bacterium]